MAHGILLIRQRKKNTRKRKKINDCKLQVNKKKTIVFVFFFLIHSPENQ